MVSIFSRHFGEGSTVVVLNKSYVSHFDHYIFLNAWCVCNERKKQTNTAIIIGIFLVIVVATKDSKQYHVVFIGNLRDKFIIIRRSTSLLN